MNLRSKCDLTRHPRKWACVRSSTNRYTVVKVIWNLGNGVVIETTEPTLSYTFLSPANLTVSATLVTFNNLSYPVSKVITVKGEAPDQFPPVASFEVMYDAALTPEKINIDVSGSNDPDGTIVGHRVNFGDNTQIQNLGTNLTGEHTYAQAGVYVIEVTAIDSQGLENTVSKVFRINQRPVISWSLSPESENPPFIAKVDASLSDDDNEIVKYTVIIDGEENESASAVFEREFINPKLYSIQLKVEDNQGAVSLSQVKMLRVNATPFAEFTQSPYTGRKPLTVNFDGASTTDDPESTHTYEWDMGGLASTTGQQTEFTFNEAGDYNIKLVVTDDLGLKSEKIYLLTVDDINEAPVASYLVDSDRGNPSFKVSFDAAASTDDKKVSSYEWDMGDGTKLVTRLPNVEHTYTTAGTFNSKLFVKDAENVVSEIVQKSIYVNNPPIANVSLDKSSGNAPLSILFDSSLTSDDIKIEKLLINYGDGTSEEKSSVGSFSHVYTSSGEYEVSFTAIDDEGAQHTITKSISVNFPPVSNLTLENSTGDYPLTVKAIASNSTDDKGILSYSFNCGNGQVISGANSTANCTYTQAGQFSLVVEVEDTQGLKHSSVKSVNVNSNPVPVALFTQSIINPVAPSEIEFDSSTSSDNRTIVSREFEYNGQKISAEKAKFYFTTSGEHVVKLTVRDDQDGVTVLEKVINLRANEGPLAIIESSQTTGSLPVGIKFNSSLSSDDDEIVKRSWFLNNIFVLEGELEYSRTFSEERINTIKLVVEDRHGLTSESSVNVNIVGPNGRPDLVAPEISFLNLDTIILSSVATISFSLTDVQGVDYDKTRIFLNGNLLDSTFINTDKANGIVSVQFSSSNKLLDNQMNVLSVRAADIFGNISYNSISYDVVDQIDSDSEGPLVTFSPNTGALENNTPLIEVFLFDLNTVDYTSLRLEVNGTDIPTSSYSTNVAENKISIQFTDNYKIEDSISIINVYISDSIGNNSFRQLGLNLNEMTVVDPNSSTTIIGDIPFEQGPSFHNCVIIKNQGAKCWGGNSQGQLGLGNKTTYGDNETPADTPFIQTNEEITKIVSARVNTCAIFESGGLKCWGNNVFGQNGQPDLNQGSIYPLGDDSNETVDLIPMMTFGSRKVIDVAPGRFQTCALFDDGNARCWGHGDYLGHQGFNYHKSVYTSVPDINLSGQATEIKGGERFSCAKLSSNSLKCWGSNGYGQLGRGVTGDVGGRYGIAVSAADPITFPNDIVDWDVGTEHVCVVLDGGNTKCWGRGLYGRLGYGNENNLGDDEPLDSYGFVSLGGSVSSISVGNEHNCVILSNGDLRCWGRNGNGVLGHGIPAGQFASAVGDNDIPTDINPVTLGGKAVYAFAGGSHSCALREDLNYYCWGAYYSGTLGSGTSPTIHTNSPLTLGPLSLGGELDIALEVGNENSISANFLSSPETGVAPLDILFDASLSVSVEDIVEYRWDFGDGTTLVTQDETVSHYYESEGLYFISLTIKDSLGEESSFERSLNIRSITSLDPIASLDLSSLSENIPFSLTLDGSNSVDIDGSIALYRWKIDGVIYTSESSLFTHTFTTVGQHQVSLEVIDNNGDTNTTGVFEVYASPVNESPVAKFNCTNIDHSLTCSANESVDFDGLISEYEWKMGDGSVLYGEDINYSYSLPNLGVYSVKLDTYDDKSLAGTITKVIQTDFTSPVFTLGEFNNLTNQTSVSIDIDVIDDSFVNVSIMNNGNIVQAGMLVESTLSIPLVEGANNIQINLLDTAGNVGVPQNLSISRDSTPPVLSSLLPIEGNDIDTYLFKVSGSSNEKLSKLTINGDEYTTDQTGKNFTQDIQNFEEGPSDLEIVAYDLAGNSTEVVISLNHHQLSLVKELITITPDMDDAGRLHVVGAVGAARPGVEVQVAGGFFSSNKSIANSRGEFHVEMDYATRFTLEATDTTYNRTTQVILDYKADTTLSGIVKDSSTDLPLANVLVTLESSGQSAITNSQGVFEIDSPRTGDQTVFFDASAVNLSNKKFSKTNLSLNLGNLQRNVIPKPVYIAPLMMNGDEREYEEGQSLSVVTPYGSLSIPSDVNVTFPTADKFINMGRVEADKVSIPLPSFARPLHVTCLEPSGLKFDKPVELELENVNEFPENAELYILSKNSSSGQWEVDGEATVTGGKVRTKPGKGVTHFSEVVALPKGGKVLQFASKVKQGADVDSGVLSEAISLPSYKSRGSDISHGLIYKSSWVKPNVVVSNYFDVDVQYTHEAIGTEGEGEGGLFQSLNSRSWVVPDFINAQFFSGSVVSDKQKFDGIPLKSVISYAMDYPLTTKSGMYPFLSEYEMHFKALTLVYGTVEGCQGDFCGEQSVYNKGEQKLNGFAPFSIGGVVPIQNKSSSSAGKGWRVAGVEKIDKVGSQRLLVEEADGAPKEYVLNNSISTVYSDPDGIKSALFSGDKIKFINNNNKILEYNLGEASASEIGQVQSLSGLLKKGIRKEVCEDSAGSVCLDNDWHCEKFDVPYSQTRNIEQFVETPSGKIFGVESIGQILELDGNTTKLLSGGTGQHILSEYRNQFNPITLEIESVYWRNKRFYTSSEKSQFCGKAGVSCSQEINRGDTDYEDNFDHACFDLVSSGDFVSQGNSIGALSSSTFNNLKGIVLSSDSERMVVSDSGNNLVKSIDISTGQVSILAGNGQNNDAGNNIQATEASIMHPRGLLYDSTGNLYISSEGGFIKKVSPSGILTRLAGATPIPCLPDGSNSNICTNAELLDETTFDKAIFKSPYGMALDESKGYLYLADTGAHVVRRLNLVTKKVITLAGNYSCDPSDLSNHKPALSTSLCSPTHLGFDQSGNLLVLDKGHNRIIRVNISSDSGGEVAYLPTNNDYSKIVRKLDGTYERSFRSGDKSSFNAEGRHISSTLRNGLSSNYEYSPEGNLISISDLNGERTRFEYSGELLSLIIDPMNRITQFIHDGDGQLSEVIYPDTTRELFQYNSEGYLIKKTNKRGFERNYFYNEWARLAKIVRENGSEINFNDAISKTISGTPRASLLENFKRCSEGDTPQNLFFRAENHCNKYDAVASKYGLTNISEDLAFLEIQDAEQGAIYSEIIDASGTKTTLLPDTQGRIVEVKAGSRKGDKIEYNEKGLVSKVVRNDDSEISFEYNEFNEIIKQTDSRASHDASTVYNDFGQSIESVSLSGLKSLNYFDSIGQMFKSEQIGLDGNKLTSTYTYSDSFLLLTSTSPDNNTTTREYDSFGNITKKIDHLGFTNEYVRDSFGNVIESVDAKGERTKTTFDSFNRLLSVKSPLNELTTYLRDEAGNLIEITDPQGKKREFSYNPINLVSSSEDQIGRLTQYDYASNNKVSKLTLPDGNEISFEYDENDRVIKKTLPDDLYQYSYDDDDNLKQVSNKNAVVDLSYISIADEFLVSQEKVIGLGSVGYPEVVTDYGYTPSGLQSSAVVNGRTFLYEHDEFERLTQLTNHKGEVFNINYDNEGKISSYKSIVSDSVFDYDNSSFVKSIRHKNISGGEIDYIAYSRDANQNRTQLRSKNFDQKVTYDQNNFVTGVEDSNFGNESFVYDSIGNRTSDQNKTLSYDPTGQLLLSTTDQTFSYDMRGNLASRTTLSNGILEKYEYSVENRMTGYEKYKNGVLLTSSRYQYGPLGRRLQKSVTDSVDSSKSQFRNYVYNGEQLVQELDESDNELAIYTSTGLRLDDTLSVDITSDGVSKGLAKSSSSYFFLKDGIGSVTHVLSESGEVLQNYIYSAFGEIKKVLDRRGSELTDLSLTRNVSYTGREFDSESGLYYYRARFYEPTLGRFLSSDPHPGVMSDPSSHVNKYMYARNNPFQYTDPSGEFVFTTALLFSVYFSSATAGSAALIAGLGFLASVEISNGVSHYEKTGGSISTDLGDYYEGYSAEELLLGSLTSAAFGAIGYTVGSSLGAGVSKYFEFGRHATSVTVGASSGAFASSFSSASLIYSGQARGGGKEVGLSFLGGAVAGAISGSVNYFFFKNYASPSILVNEGGFFLYLNSGGAPSEK